jgi:hypothetical protein
MLAQALAVNGDRDAAGLAARSALAPGKDVPYLVSDMVWPVLAYAGDWSGAEAELRRWTGPEALPARQASARIALSFLLAAQGRAREVRALGLEIRGGKFPELSYWATAMADMLEGNRAAAARSFREAGTNAEAPVVAWLGDQGGAAQMADKLAPGSTEARLFRAVNAWQQGDRETAAAGLRALAAGSGDAGALRYLGEFLCEREAPAEGSVLLGRWLDRTPTAVTLGRFAFRPAMMIALARCQERLGQRPEAFATVERFLSDWRRADPDLPMLVEAKAMQARLGAGATAR